MFGLGVYAGAGVLHAFPIFWLTPPCSWKIVSCSMYGIKKKKNVPYVFGMKFEGGYGGGPAKSGGNRLNSAFALWHANEICFKLFSVCVRAAASRTFWTAGTKSPMRMAMMAITTRSSTRVKPDRRWARFGSMDCTSL